MLKEAGTLELPISYTTEVADLEEILNKKKIYNMKHPTIKLLAYDTLLADKGIVLLFSGFNIHGRGRKVKAIVKKEEWQTYQW